MEDAPKLLKIPKTECPDIWIRLPRHKWPKSWSSMEDPVVPLERNLYGHPLAGLLWERQFEKILLKHGWEKVSNWECLFVHREKGLLLCVYVDDIKLAAKRQNIDPMWKVLHEEVDLGEPTSFLDHVYLGYALKDNVKQAKILWTNTEPCLNREDPENLLISSWSYDMEGHSKKCVEWYCELANKTTQQLYKVSAPCIDDHHFKEEEEELKSVGELSKVCSQIVLKCFFLARIGRPDILWSVKKLARSTIKWTKAWPWGWCPQSVGFTSGGGPARVPNLRVCKHLWSMGGTRRVWRMNSHPAVVPSSRRGNTSSESQKRENRAAQ